MSTRRNQLLTALCLLTQGTAMAATPCRSSQTVGQCWDRVVSEITGVPLPAGAGAEAVKAIVDAEETRSTRAARETVQASPTGTDSGGGTLESATKNFLPWLSVSGLLGALGRDDGEGNLLFDLNFLLPHQTTKHSQLQAVLAQEPTLSMAAAEMLPEATREALETKLNKTLDAADDFSLSYSYTLTGLNHGRDFEPYRLRYRNLVAGVRADAQAAVVDRSDKLLDSLEELRKKCGPPLPESLDLDDLVFSTFATRSTGDSGGKAVCGSEDVKKALDLVLEAAESFGKSVAASRQAIAKAGLLRFGELVANQPQFYVTAKLRKRDPLVGGDEFSGKLSYEWARTNLATAMSTSCHETLNQGGNAACAKEFADYLEKHADAIARGNRFSFSVEYVDIDEARIPFSTLLPEASIADATLAGATRRIVKLGWSRLFDTAPDLYRLDFVGSYDDVSDDPMRRDRLVATLSIERKVGKDWSIPLGIVYANHGQYLPEVDERLSAHIGLKFNVSDQGQN